MQVAYTRRKHLPFSPPVGIRRLPFNLKRDSLVTRRPDLVQAAFAAYQRHMSENVPMPVLMPQPMAMQQWKTDPDGHRKDWYSSAVSWHALVSGYTHGVPNTLARKLPRYPSYAELLAARLRGAEILPQPATQPSAPIISRSTRSNRPTATFEGRWEPPPAAIRQAHQEMHARRRANMKMRYSAALNEVGATIAQTRSIVGR